MYAWMIRVKIDNPKDSVWWSMGRGGGGGGGGGEGGNHQANTKMGFKAQNIGVKVQNDICTNIPCVVPDSSLLTHQ